MGKEPKRFIGLDIHKEYFVAVGVNPQREVVFGPQKVSNYQLDNWILRYLTPGDAVVLEMTTNTYLFYDCLLPHVHSVIAVHPPNVSLVTNAQVKTDQKAALALAQLHAVGMLTGVWIPPTTYAICARSLPSARRWFDCQRSPRIGCMHSCTVST